jgi:hypothetical protein
MKSPGKIDAFTTPQGTLFGLRPVGSTRFDSTRTQVT